jgi:hypothetical protein
MTGIQFVTDEKGRKTAVLSDLKKHHAIWEDFWDGLVSESRRKERGIPYEEYRAKLEIKPSAGKELDALDDALFARIDRKILVLAENPRPPGCK